MSHNLAIHPVFLNTPPSIRVTVQYSIRRVVTAYRLVQAVVSTVVVRGERGGGRERDRERAPPPPRARARARVYSINYFILTTVRALWLCQSPKKQNCAGRATERASERGDESAKSRTSAVRQCQCQDSAGHHTNRVETK